MKTRSKALLLALCALSLVAATVFGTLAYLTDKDNAVNTFTVGNVGISLDETDVKPDGTKNTETRVQENDYHLLPGHTYIKDPIVHVDANSEDCYVRMYVTITKSTQWDQICDNHNNTFTAGNIFYHNETVDGEVKSVEGINLNAWDVHANTEDLAGENTRTYELWYKSKVVKSETQTDLTSAFDSIVMPDQLTNDDLKLLGNEEFKIYVVAQAIQADGFDTAAKAFTAIPGITGTDLMPAAGTTVTG